ncbi:MFS transporter [Nocardioides taihuensis]|uniref:MFS transporter n=1 Tax=Nocardioides taihuensis TaxID=1835606 RepID=A0ABW0BHJ6_9ACTN
MTTTPSPGRPRAGLALTLLAATQFLLVLDSAIVNVALPSVQHDLGFDGEQITWVVNAYGLLFAGLLLLGGRLADLLGARRVFVGGLTLFTAASVAGALAATPGGLVAARGAQGAGAALAAPSAMALALILFPAGAGRHRALGLMGAAAGLGGASGSLLGGILTETWGWQAILWINVPVGALVVAGAVVALPAGRLTGARGRLDVAGAATVTTGLVTLVYGLVLASQRGWTSGQALAALGTAAGLLAVFALVEARGEQSLVPPSLARIGSLRRANLAAGLSAMAMMPMWFLLTVYFQQVRGYGPVEAGAAVLPVIAMLVLFNSLAHRIIARTGLRTPLAGGLLMAAAGLAWVADLGPAGAPYAADMLAPQLLIGIGFGIAFIAGTVAATQDVPPERSGVASGIYTTAQQVGGAVGLAVLAAIPARAQHDGAPLGDALSHSLLVAAVFALAAGLAALRLAPRRATDGPAAGAVDVPRAARLEMTDRTT